MAWECKNCECREFRVVEETRVETICAEFNEYGLIEDYVERTRKGDDVIHYEISCENCGKKGDNLIKVANWEE